MPLSPQEKANLTRWSLLQKNFYETYRLKWHDPAEKVSVLLCYSLAAPIGKEPSISISLLFFDAVEGSRNQIIQKTFPLQESRIEKDFFYFAGGPCAIFQSGARGELEGASWELKFQEPSLSLQSILMGKWTAPYWSVPVTGEFQFGERKMKLDRVFAHQSHFWGHHPHPFVTWAQCNTHEIAFEGYVKQFALSDHVAHQIPFLFFRWNETLLRLDTPPAWLTMKSEVSADRWHFEGKSGNWMLIGDLYARPEEMIPFENIQVTLTADFKCQILKKTRKDWESVESFLLPRSAAYEVRGRK